MNVFTNTAIRHLQAQGYRVMSLADPPDLAEAQRALLANGFHVAGPSEPPDLTQARKVLEHAGMRVVPNHRSVPSVGSEWAPSYGRKRLSAFSRRKVIEASQQQVIYYDVSDPDLLVPIALRSWHAWKSRTQAKLVA